MESIGPRFIPLCFVDVERDEQLERGKRFFELLGRLHFFLRVIGRKCGNKEV